MPNLAMAEETMCRVLNEAWQDRTPIAWPNVAWPAATPHPREGEAPWAAFYIRHDGSDQATIAEEGRRTFTRTGGLSLQVFVPAGQRGLTDATALAMVAANAFEGKTVDGVRFYRVGVRTVGADRTEVKGQDTLSDAWFQVNVHADFEFDEIK